ncbi:hypothetical protein MIND_01001200 [Mycena indigotica]|uniref:NodB homology domain-containing protein n=1 Tax=Mycena indigotica TaxID=2126181 RepID=A0A8H6S9G5_9AGAR|nr:uncharacterized protein MIND_01001200 [Mycena indigotica]KAF7294645.1 hypothetical protein MIND_01001200 [Mycena indigotica]
MLAMVWPLLALSTFAAVLAVPTPQNHSHLEAREPQVYGHCVNSKEVAMTFDDGPFDHLRSISDQFTAAGAKATFFWNGNNYDCLYNLGRAADMRYAFAAGHQVGSHGWTHVDLTTLSRPQIRDNMYRIEEAFSRILGIRPAFMRPPFGAYNGNVRDVATDRGQSLALWDHDTKDSDGATVSFSRSVYRQITNSMKDNGLVLQHETVGSTATQLVPYAINLFQSKGYKLVTLAECLGVDPYQVVGFPQQRTPAWTCNGSPGPGTACGGSSGIACKSGTPPVSTGINIPLPNQYIHPIANSGKCLAATSNSDGAPVTIQDCTTSASQSWTITGTGTLSIYGDKCLDVVDGRTASGTRLQLWTCASGNGNQQFTLSGQTIQWTGHSSCVDVTDGVLTNGNRMQIWECAAGNRNQQFTRTTGPGSGNNDPTPKTIRPNKSSTTCLTAVANNDGAAVVVRPCTNGAAPGQIWTQNGATIVVHGNKCLDVTDFNDSNGAKMQIWSCTPGQGNGAQQFTVTPEKTIRWNGHNRCVDLTEGRTTTDNRIQSWECSSPSAPNPNQIWNFV